MKSYENRVGGQDSRIEGLHGRTEKRPRAALGIFPVNNESLLCGSLFEKWQGARCYIVFIISLTVFAASRFLSPSGKSAPISVMVS